MFKLSNMFTRYFIVFSFLFKYVQTVRECQQRKCKLLKTWKLDATRCHATGCYWMLLARSWSWKALPEEHVQNLRKALAWRALLGLSGFMKAALGMWTKMRKNIGLRLPHLATWSRVERMHGPGWSFKEHFWLSAAHVRPKQRLSRFVHDIQSRGHLTLCWLLIFGRICG